MAATAITGRQVIRQNQQDNMLLGATAHAAAVCAGTMVENAIHGAAYDKFPKCAPQTIALPDGVAATITFEDNLRSTDASDKYSRYEYIWGDNPKSDHVTFPLGTMVLATATVDGNKYPIKAEVRFDSPNKWTRTLDF
jgi:heme A synthase